jgi:hypothetical protein
MYVSLAEAGKMVGKDKTTLLRSIRSGKLSAERDEHGQWRIQAAEVTRVYPPVTRMDTQPSFDAAELACTRLELSGARALLEQLREQLRDVLADRDHWREQAQATRLCARTNGSNGKRSLSLSSRAMVAYGVGIRVMGPALIALVAALQRRPSLSVR